jgi:hypothetical protein
MKKRLARFGFSSNENLAAFVIFCCGVGALLYAAISLALFGVAAALLQQGVVSSNTILRDNQRVFYSAGFRRIWQAQRECVEFDEILLYVPRQGECKFDNVEFKTIQSFDELGRVTKGKTNNVGIAVLGDSHAMGWGVGNDETFAAHLERMTGRPVFNLAVSSYGTYREMARLERSGILNRIDTIIVQYSDNDIWENIESLDHARTYSPQQFDAIFSQARQDSLGIVGSWIIGALKSPARAAKRLFFDVRAEFNDFTPHYAALIKVLDRFSWAKERRVLIFYTNEFGVKFSNFADVANLHVRGSIEFVDLNLGVELFFVLDDHLNKAGHRKIAEELFTILNFSYRNPF